MSNKAKKIIKWTLIGLAGVIAAILVIFFAMFHRELKTLSSLKKVDDYPLYTMTYAGDYGFDEFLEVGASSDAELIDFIVQRLLKGLPLEFSVPDLGCSTFNAHTPDGDAIFGRNFDLDFSPAVMVKTTPDNGYASISMVNLGFLGYNKENLPDSFISSITALAAPYAPLDGVNEKGLSIGVLLIEDEPTHQDNGKIDINTTTAIRLVLDKAATVEEALELLQQYDMHSSANSCYHYQIADASGKSVIAEYVKNEFHVVEATTNWQACTNFLQTPGEFYNLGKGQDRYEILSKGLSAAKGIVTEEAAMDLLEAASADGSIPREDGSPSSTTQWSVIYNNAKGTAKVSMGMDYDRIYEFSIAS